MSGGVWLYPEEQHEHRDMIWLGEPVATVCYCGECGQTWELRFEQAPVTGETRCVGWVITRRPARSRVDV